ncbi:MAG: ATP-binding protein, partial [Solirubrobacterales bacterium]
MSVASIAVLGLGVTFAVAVSFLVGRRRRELAWRVHELRGSLTAARLVVDLMPVRGEAEPAACLAAGDELTRSYHSLCAFERRLHTPLWGDIARMGARSARVRPRGLIAVRDELERLTLIWSQAARRCDRDLRVDLQIGAPDVRGARRHLTEAVANLLSNAIRHGEGTVTLSARERDGMLRIEVGDQGPGLVRPVAAMASARRVPLRRLGPHGHGLSIAVRAANRLGGAVS